MEDWHLLDSKVYYKAVVTKTVQYWCKDRHIDQWKVINSSEIEPHIHNQLIFNKDTKENQWESTAFLTNGIGTTEYSLAK